MTYEGVIADFKRYSPHDGEVWGKVPVDAWTKEVPEASALSVVVHPDWGGSMDDLRKAREADDRPLIAKHLRSKGDVLRAQEIGADAALFVLRAMRDRQPLRLALGIGLDVIAEVHEQSEVTGRLPSSHAVTINRRNVFTGQFVEQRFTNLLPLVPHGVPVIAASGYGIEVPTGADAVLVGTYFARRSRGV